MVDVLVLTGGEFDTQENPSEWWRVTAGEVVPESGSGASALQISAGERVTVTGPVLITVDCADLNVCSVGVTAGACDTLSGCDLDGEMHRIEWNTTGCVDASHHIALHRSVNGGSFVEVADVLACAPSNPDVGCCESAVCTEGQHLIQEGFHDESGKTTDYQYKVRIEDDGTDTLAQAGSELESNTETDQGGDTACFLA